MNCVTKEYHVLYNAVLGCVGVNVEAVFSWWGTLFCMNRNFVSFEKHQGGIKIIG